MAQITYSAPATTIPQIKIHGNDTIDFGTNWCFTFGDPRLLEEACTMKFFPPGVPRSLLPEMNNGLALVGDGQATALIRTRWKESAVPISVYKEIYADAMGKNKYLARVAEVRGVLDNMMMMNGMAREFWPQQPSEHEKATAVEAIFGAVWMDLEGKEYQKEIFEKVLAEFGVFWPLSKKGEKVTKKTLFRLHRANVI